MPFTYYSWQQMCVGLHINESPAGIHYTGAQFNRNYCLKRVLYLTSIFLQQKVHLYFVLFKQAITFYFLLKVKPIHSFFLHYIIQKTLYIRALWQTKHKK